MPRKCGQPASQVQWVMRISKMAFRHGKSVVRLSRQSVRDYQGQWIMHNFGESVGP
jgi:hypothetical protein